MNDFLARDDTSRNPYFLLLNAMAFLLIEL